MSTSGARVCFARHSFPNAGTLKRVQSAASTNPSPPHERSAASVKYHHEASTNCCRCGSAPGRSGAFSAAPPPEPPRPPAQPSPPQARPAAWTARRADGPPLTLCGSWPSARAALQTRLTRRSCPPRSGSSSPAWRCFPPPLRARQRPTTLSSQPPEPRRRALFPAPMRQSQDSDTNAGLLLSYAFFLWAERDNPSEARSPHPTAPQTVAPVGGR